MRLLPRSEPGARFEARDERRARKSCVLFPFAAVAIFVLALPMLAQTSAPPAVPDATQSRSSDQPAPQAQPTPPPYHLLRHEEDYGYLRDPERRTDYLDPIKYIPLRGGREDWYMSVGGEVRPFYQYFSNEDLGSQPRDENGFWMQRYVLHLDVHTGERVRTFVQFKSGIETNRAGGPRGADEDKLDVHQAFVDLKFGGRREAPRGLWDLEGNNTGTAPRHPFELRVGRQEFLYGTRRFVGPRDGNNVRQSFDGVRALARAGQWRVDAFLTKPVNTGLGYFDDGWQRRVFWGVYAVRPLLAPPKLNADFYYLGLTDRTRNVRHFDQGIAPETRHTVGTRLWNQARAGLDYDVELAYQFGTFGPGRIRAYTLAANTGYEFNTRFRPRVGVRADIASGDRDPTNQDLQTFNVLYSDALYEFYGFSFTLGGSNMRSVHPTVRLDLPKRVQVRPEWVFYWRDSLRDGVYNLPGFLLRSGRGGSRARFVGHQPGIQVTWQMNRHTLFLFRASRLNAGPFLRENSSALGVTNIQARISYQF